MRFGEMLREARRAKGLSGAELGAGVYSTHYILLLERGQRQPTPDMVRHLAKVLGMDARILAWWVEPPSGTDESALAAAMHNASNASDLQDDVLTASEAEYAASIAQEQGNAAAWWTMANLHVQALMALRRYDDADTVLRALGASALAARRPELRVVVLARQSVILRSRGRLTEAVEIAQTAVDVASALPASNAVRLEAAFVLLAALSVQGRLDDAWALIEELHLEAADPVLPSSLIGKGAWAVGNVAFRRGDVEIGLAQHRLAAELLLAKTDVESWAAFHHGSATERMYAGLVDDEVWQSIQNAQLGLQISGTDEQRQEVKLQEAHFHLRSGQPHLAGPLLTEVEATGALQDFELVSLLQRLLGEYHASQGDILRSRKYFQTAITLLEEAGAMESGAEIRELLNP
jgi:transcriptional regulator with XRE-family HTH domain